MKTKTPVQTIKKLALALAAAALPTFAMEYYWIGGSSDIWEEGANWSLADGGAPANECPGASDTAIFGGNASIAMTAGINVNTLEIGAGARVQFASSDYKVLQVNAVTGDATSTLALSNVIVIPAVSGAPVSGQIELVAGTKNGLYGASGMNLNVNGNLTGTGEVYFRNYATKGSRGGVLLNGDNSQFAGVAHILMANGLDMRGSSGYATTFKWTTLSSGSANARWLVEGSDGNNGPQFPPATVTSEANPFRLGTLEGVKYVAGGANAVFYLEVGGNGMDFEYGGTIDRGSSSNGTKLTKVGAGTMTFSGGLADRNTTASVTIKEGAVKFCTAASLPAAGIIMAGGTLKAGVEDGVKLDLSAKISTSSSGAVIYDDEGDDSVWASLGAVTTGLVKKGNGMLTIMSASYTGATKVDAGRLNLPTGMTLDLLDVEAGASMGLCTAEAYGEPTTVMTIRSVGDGMDLATAIPNTATQTFSFETDGVSGEVSVKVVRTPHVFTWTGSVDSSWENVANWRVGGLTVTEIPSAIDTVLFPAKAEGGWNVAVARDTHIVAITNNAPVTLTGAGDIYLGSVGSELEAAPVLTLGDDATIRSENARDAVLSVDVPLNITASADHPANVWGRWMKDSGGTSSLYLNRELTGTGSVVMAQSRGGIFFNGTNTAFAGSLVIRDDSSSQVSGATRTSPEFVLPDATSSNAVWTIFNYGSLLKASGKTYCFGALNGTVSLNSTQSSYMNNTLEIGARDDVDSNLSGNFFNNSYIGLVESRGNAIRKVGSSTLTVSAARVKSYEINGGTVVIANNRSIRGLRTGDTTEVDDPTLEGVVAYYAPIQFGGGVLGFTSEVTADPSAGIMNSSAPIAISNDTDRVFATALAASNVGGLTKKGSGMLTLSAAPLYTGLTTVEDGTLVVPAESSIVYNPLSAGTISGVTPTSFAYPAGTTLTGGEANNSLTGSLDISNVGAIDVSAATLTKGRPFVVVSATAVTGYTKESLAAIPLTLPAGVDAEKWTVKVMTVDGKIALCVAPKFRPTCIVIR